MGGDGKVETQPRDTSIASDDTVQHDSSQPTPAHLSTGPKIRISNPSLELDHLGRYVITKQLGRGGMGAVYEAADPELGRRVAIKVLRDDRNDASFTEGLKREAQALAKLVHPNVVTVYDVGVDEGRVFVVMQLVDGESIDRWLLERKARAPQIVAAFRTAGRGLAAAHAAGLVHCDFKPANVLVDRDGNVRVSDFGLARIGEGPGSIAGTPRYMAPEQFTGVATAASDQYSFCVAVCEVLLGKTLFPESKIHDIESARARPLPQFPRATGVPAYVVHALHRGLAREPNERFPSMDALLAALAPPAWRRWALAGTAAAVVLGGTVLATSALSSSTSERRVIVPDAGLVGMPDLAAAHALTQYGMTACAYAPSIDGDHVVFDRTEGDAVDLYAIPLAGGTPRQLTSAPTWEWRSNPGRHVGEVIHLIHDPKDLTAAQLAYLDVASGRETEIARVEAPDAGVTTTGVVYVPKGGLELRKLDGPRDVVLTKVPEGRELNQLAVSHRGDRVALVAYKAHDSQLCIVDAATGVSACSAAPDAQPYRPAFGADDRSVYYAGKDGIHRQDLQSHADSLIVADVLPKGGLAVTADGRALVYSDCGTRSQIVEWGAHPTTLVDAASAHSPSGTSTKNLVWVRTARGTSVLVARDEDGHELQITAPDFGDVSAPAISPNGNYVAFVSGPPHPGIYVTTLVSGADLVHIDDDPRDFGPVWVGDSQIAFSRTDDRGPAKVFTARSDGAMLHELPGGTRFVLGGRGHRALVATKWDLYWVDVNSGAEQRGPQPDLHGGSFPVTSPDGRWLLVRSGGEAQILERVLLDPLGKVETLPAIPSGQTIERAAITNDGHVLLAPQAWSGDLHIIPAQAGSRF